MWHKKTPRHCAGFFTITGRRLLHRHLIVLRGARRCIVDHQRNAAILEPLFARALGARHDLTVPRLAIAHRLEERRVERAVAREVTRDCFSAAHPAALIERGAYGMIRYLTD